MKKHVFTSGKNRHLLITVIISLILTSLSGTPLFANTLVKKDSWRDKAVKIFLDLSYRYKRYSEYIKTEIPFVNYVRDGKQAQVFVMVTTQRTGSNGTEFTVTFLGQGNFASMNDTLKYVSKKTDTEEIIREGLVHTIKLGLVRYVAKTPSGTMLKIKFPLHNSKITTITNDKWDHWVFGINVSTRLQGQESTKSSNIDGSLTVDRVTNELKISMFARAEYDDKRYNFTDYQYSSTSKSYMMRSTIVKSLGEHWSAGFTSSVNSSTYSNAELSGYFAPAVEYDIFPYSESTRRQFRIMYRLGYHNNKYFEETIYGKTEEILYSQRLDATVELREKWGSINTTLTGSHYLHDFDKNQLRLSGFFSFRIFEGFELTAHGRVSMIHDQISLPKEEATEEEILLQRKQLSTQYNYSVRLGVRFTFGSIYNNIVNPRFGN